MDGLTNINTHYQINGWNGYYGNGDIQFIACHYYSLWQGMEEDLNGRETD